MVAEGIEDLGAPVTVPGLTVEVDGFMRHSSAMTPTSGPNMNPIRRGAHTLAFYVRSTGSMPHPLVAASLAFSGSTYFDTPEKDAESRRGGSVVLEDSFSFHIPGQPQPLSHPRRTSEASTAVSEVPWQFFDGNHGIDFNLAQPPSQILAGQYMTDDLPEPPRDISPDDLIDTNNPTSSDSSVGIPENSILGDPNLFLWALRNQTQDPMANSYSNVWPETSQYGLSQSEMQHYYGGSENNTNAFEDAESTPEQSNTEQTAERVKCDTCGEFFSRTSISKHKKRVHHPQKLFSCGVCKLRFEVRRDLNRHKDTVHAESHPGTPKIAYGCKLCFHNAARKDNVMRHLKNVHGVVEDRHQYFGRCWVIGTQRTFQDS